MKNPRRPYDKDYEFKPMDLANLRDHGCRNVMIECRRCGRDASVNVDALDGAVPSPISRSSGPSSSARNAVHEARP